MRRGQHESRRTQHRQLAHRDREREARDANAKLPQKAGHSDHDTGGSESGEGSEKRRRESSPSAALAAYAAVGAGV